MDPQQQFCLKWNSYSSNLAITFSNLFKSDLLADVTLSCDGAVFKAHKLILAACSKKFADLFENTPTNGQCVIILEATTPDNMAALLEFMYKGEVHVSQEALNSFLKSAESLQVKGLSTETGRLAAQQAQQQQHMGDSSPLDSPTGRRSMRNSLSGGNGNSNILPGGGAPGVGIGLGGVTGANSIPGGLGNGNGLSLAGALSGMAAAGGMAAAASVAASGLSALAASANALDRCGSAGGNIIGGTAAGMGPLSGGTGTGGGGGNGGGMGGVGGNGVGGNNGPISLGSGAGAAHHLGGSTGSLKQECDSLMHPGGSSSSSGGMGYTHVPPIYRPISYEPLRKRALRSPYAEQEQRGSVLRDGSKNSSSECPSPINKPPYHRPSSSASSTAPTEADTMHSERASPQSSRYENHSPSTTAGNGNVTSGLDRIVKSERNNGSANEANDDDRELMEESADNGAEDLRVKLENSNYSPPPPPNSNTSSTTTPNALLENLKNADGSLSGNLAASIAPADMLNVWNATKMNNKNSVNTADGKKLKCLYCDRLYGYETNLRAHIRQRHQGIRVPCPFCERTFTRNNTEAAATAAAAVVMNAHKEAAKQRKRKSLKMALEKCMQRRDAMVAESTTGAGGEADNDGAASEGAVGSGGNGGGAGTGSAGTEPPFTYEQQQQRMHQELALQIKAAMAAEQAQAAAEAEANASVAAEAMDSTMNTTANTNTTGTSTTATTTTTTTNTNTTSDGCSDDAEASDDSERPMEVDEQPPEPQPGSELLVVEPKIEVLSDSEDEEDQLHMQEEDDEDDEEPSVQAEAIYDHMPTTPTSPTNMIPPPNETPILTSTPKVNVEQ
ncbi:hypothetical protein KR054_011155 [Drosophila jambulina]|nr:hypothetical protein KR054_011155 [Drosophila jambulina]